NTGVGQNAGLSNTVEAGNSLFGAGADSTAGINNATAVGFQAQVSQSNSLVLGSIAGLNEATNNVRVGIGTPTPDAALHVSRADGTAQLKVEETSGTTANRVLFRLTNNGGPWFKLLNSNTGQEWTFAMDQFDNFIFSKIGTGGAEFKIYKSGAVTMGPGGSEIFDLQPTGDLEIAGGLTAGGIYYASDRNKKTDIRPLSSEEVLETIARLPVSTWRFKTESTQIRHAGPMAQDFYAAFGLGNDDKTISASDISGLALAAIQGLYQQNVQTRAELVSKGAALRRLQAQMQVKDAQLAAQGKRIAKLEAQQAEVETLRAGLRELQAVLQTHADTAPARHAAE
ncbi:MAG: tail fiber domain-containing protein, partial [Acidobacteriota bacterium]